MDVHREPTGVGSGMGGEAASLDGEEASSA